MSTRSLTIIYNKKDLPILNLYRHSDGYPQGHGSDLAEFLSDMRIVNGLDGSPGRKANGMGCLAAQLVAYFKDGPGSFYIYPIETRDVWQEYEYHIHERHIDVYNVHHDAPNEIIFSGKWDELGDWCEHYGDDE